jgi:hypothetical protein
MREIWDWGGVPEIHVIGPGSALKLPVDGITLIGQAMNGKTCV